MTRFWFLPILLVCLLFLLGVDRITPKVTESAFTSDYNVDVIDEVKVPACDGVKLDARLLKPEAEGERPTVILLNGYGIDGSAAESYEEDLKRYAESGYAVLHISARGLGDSEGEGGLYKGFGTDGHDAVEWAASQSWSTGDVGMLGRSLQGTAQWLTAAEAPPALKAISPEVSCADCYEHLWYPGGMEMGPGRSLFGGYGFQGASKHRTYDDWWENRTVTAEDFQAMSDAGIAVLASGGWQDYLTDGTVDAYTQFHNAGGKGLLVVGPEAHGGFEDVAPYPFDELEKRFMDAYVKQSRDEPPLGEAAALLYQYETEAWFAYENWPAVPKKPFYLRAQSSESLESDGDYSLRPKPPTEAKEPALYEFTKAHGPYLNTFFEQFVGRTTEDQTPVEERVATWTTPPLKETAALIGTPVLNVYAAFSKADADIAVQLSVVAEDGTSTLLTSGYQHAPAAEAPYDTLADPHQPREYTVDFAPMSVELSAGSRLRLSIAGGTVPETGMYIAEGPGLNDTSVTTAVHHDALHPSKIQLPLMRGEVAAFQSSEEADDEHADGAAKSGFLPERQGLPSFEEAMRLKH
ncbi:putative CocE/NonD family hydrolase [Salsuginibacillus halophilus]|uniref:Putative CocE/NonD family hydrolase n=1 Tax=Salsuginibacillus halophilus TaxID=517424 RepID=A0A2P8HHT9_9BACI|nr:CocE/NonD family hydrolase [Salsuginibacillus halophilus]PSL45794.1 putative CocE/NonD family hydrolase [Salsuginibacillus halophilus]